jgi:hypothetical protein
LRIPTLRKSKSRQTKQAGNPNELLGERLGSGIPGKIRLLVTISQEAAIVASLSDGVDILS